MEISDELWKALTGGEIEIEFDQSAGNTKDRIFGKILKFLKKVIKVIEMAVTAWDEL